MPHWFAAMVMLVVAYSGAYLLGKLVSPGAYVFTFLIALCGYSLAVMVSEIRQRERKANAAFRW